MDVLTLEDFKQMINRAFTEVQAQETHFSALDAIAGDGDHGTAITEALSAVNDSAREGTDFNQMLTQMAMNAMTRSCGSTSTLIGGFFLGMGTAVKGDQLDVPQVKTMFRAGLASMQNNTQAKPGDKTLMDALVPAVTAMETAEGDIKAVFRAGAEAAASGAAATVEMQAAFGRARNLGERSIGHADPGASSWACMFGAFYNAIN